MNLTKKPIQYLIQKYWKKLSETYSILEKIIGNIFNKKNKVPHQL